MTSPGAGQFRPETDQLKQRRAADLLCATNSLSNCAFDVQRQALKQRVRAGPGQVGRRGGRACSARHHWLPRSNAAMSAPYVTASGFTPEGAIASNASSAGCHWPAARPGPE